MKTFVALVVIGAMFLGTVATSFAFNSIAAGTSTGTGYTTPINQPAKLVGSNNSLNGESWTPFGSYDKELFQLHPGQTKTPNMRLYPKPDGATLPPVGWNSWNAFFSNISAATIAQIADQIADKDPITGEPLNGLELYKCGYKYVIVDDGCYQSSTSFTPNTSSTRNFASFAFNDKTGFGALSDYVHSLGLKYGMYNDAGPTTCAGSGPGSIANNGGREDPYAATLNDWSIDTLKYDWCRNPWGIQNNYPIGGGIRVQQMSITGNGFEHTTSWAGSAPSNVIYAGNASRNSAGYLGGIGMTSGTQMRDPTVTQGYAHVTVTDVPEYGTYNLTLTRQNNSTSTEARYIMIDVNGERQFETYTTSSTSWTTAGTSDIPVTLKAGTNVISLYNTKNQEIGIYCYAAMRDALNKSGGQNVSLKQCDWGNTGPQYYGHMVGESHRQYSDIFGEWATMGSWGWTRDEHNRAVFINDRYDIQIGGSWSDPDMMVVGLGTTRAQANRWTVQQNKQHFDAWAIVNSPLILGFDLRDASIRDYVADIITNRNIIALNQDPLGVAGRRIKVSTTADPRSYVTGNRVEAIMKPLANGDVAIYFGNWSGGATATMTLNMNEVVNSYVADYMTNKDTFAQGITYWKNLNTGAVGQLADATTNITASFTATNDSVTYCFSKTPFTEGLTSDSYFGVGLAFDQIDFVGGKIPIGPTEWHQNRANGIATINNNTGANVNAAIKLDLFDAKGGLVWSKTGPAKIVEPGWLYSWEYKEALPDFVTGYSMTISLVDTVSGTLLAPSNTRRAAAPVNNKIELSLAGGTFTNATVNNPAGTTSTSSLDTALTGSNPVTATATVYNDTNAVINANIILAVYRDGRLLSVEFCDPVAVLPDDNPTFSETVFMPADIKGVTVEAFLWNADTYVPLAPSAKK